MSRLTHIGRRGIALSLVVLVVAGAVPGVVAAEERTGGSVTVGAGETVSEDLTIVAGDIVVRGTVEGDLEAIGGNVVIASGAEITGDVDATGGNVRIDGTIGGNVTASGGNVFVGQSATIGGPLEASAGSIVIAGAVDGDARLGAGSITLAPSATFGGDVEYSVGDDGEFTNEGATIAGSLTENPDLEVGGDRFDVPDFAGPVFGVYGFLVNLLVGALLLFVLPGTSRRVAESVSESPLRTGAIGLGALIGTPIVLLLVAITIVGIPLSLAGLATYALAVWIATIYGRYAVGELLLSYTDVENRWAALAVGLVIVAILVRIPFVGGLFGFVVLLLGLGAMATLLYRFVRAQRGPETVPAEEATPA
jgi:cytoskeletal protein CcmA (bactofilin family)